jgi:hypothetical protein
LGLPPVLGIPNSLDALKFPLYTKIRDLKSLGREAPSQIC